MPKLMIDTDDLSAVEIELHTTTSDIDLFFRIVAALQDKLAQRERANGTLAPLTEEVAKRLSLRANAARPSRHSAPALDQPRPSDPAADHIKADIDLTREE